MHDLPKQLSLRLGRHPDGAGRPSGDRTVAEATNERFYRGARKIEVENPSFPGALGPRVFKLDFSGIRTREPDRNDPKSGSADIGHTPRGQLAVAAQDRKLPRVSRLPDRGKEGWPERFAPRAAGPRAGGARHTNACVRPAGSSAGRCSPANRGGKIRPGRKIRPPDGSKSEEPMPR